MNKFNPLSRPITPEEAGTEEEDELAPCKKCGSKAEVELIGNNHDGHMPICTNEDCEHMLEKYDYDTRAEAIEAWNRENLEHNLGGWMADYTPEELAMIYADHKHDEAKDIRAMEESDNEPKA